ncbi:hypothetical protein ACVWYG_002007 [Pedobacter sp. UYEF25]
MKTNLLMLTAFLGLSVSAYAQKNIPTIVKSAFAKEYPGVKANWDKEGNKYEASFKMKENSMSVLYSPKGVAEETEMDMKADMLPAAVKAYLAKNFKTEKIKEAAKITKADGTVEYEAEIKGKDYLFTPEGKFIKAVKD